MNRPLNEPHHHLGEDALWEMAEARVAGQVMGPGAEHAPEIAAAQACPQCAPRLQAATKQIAALRTLPEVKAPPDFLLLVQNRIEAENTFWKRLLATLRGWVLPGRTGGVPSWAPGGVPLGFASAALVVIVLIVALPEVPLPVKSEEKQVMDKQEVTEKKQVMDEERVTFELPKVASPSKAKSSPAKPTAELFMARAARAEPSPPAEAAPASAPIALTTAPAPAAGVEEASELKAISSLSKSAPPTSGAAIKEWADQATARNEMVDADDATPAPKGMSSETVAKRAKKENGRSDAAERIVSSLPLRLTKRGDTLFYAGEKRHAEALRRLVDSLGLASKAHFDLRDDSVFLQLRP